MLFKDACNRKSNQQNLGTIKCSNLCTEIVEFTSPEETAVCNLASIALPRYVREREASPSTGRPKLTGSLNAPNRQALTTLQYLQQSPWSVAAASKSKQSSSSSITFWREHHIVPILNRYFDFEKLREITHTITDNLNKIIDINFYPAETARRSNMRHRPIGIGVQVMSVVQCSETSSLILLLCYIFA